MITQARSGAECDRFFVIFALAVMLGWMNCLKPSFCNSKQGA
ncbi:hypothetical protein [Bacillus sp. FJAT-49736]|nr:hypothetical protein [Bacillus sp. FJAT-49736]